MGSNAAQPSLTPNQLNALFDILTHNETFHEIRDLRYELPISHFGLPITPAEPGPSPYPLLQLVISKFVGRGLVSESGWADFLSMIKRLCAVNLSDSYDKGFLGLRKHSAAGIAASLGSVARGVLARPPRDPQVKSGRLNTRSYDRTNAGELEQAWDDTVQGMLYGDLLDRVFEAVKVSPDLNDIPPVARAALDYFMVCGATLMHYMLVVVPEGQNLVKMLETMDTLTPYSIIKQTVRVGNVQYMLNGVVKILLAKVGDKNLIQTMVSRAIKLDLHDLERRAEKIKKKSKDGTGLPKEISIAIEDYIHQPRSVQENMRLRSQQDSKSIIACIFDSFYPVYPPQTVQDITPDQHILAIEYLAVQLSIRDRLESIQTICKEKPDLLTPVIQNQMDLLAPLLKALHDGKFDIGHIITLQKAFTADLIKTAKITKDHAPGVDDFYTLFQGHMPALWKDLHEGARKCPQLHDAVYGWCSASIQHFRSPDACEDNTGVPRTGAATDALLGMFDKLPDGAREEVRSVLDGHGAYLGQIRDTSRAKLQEVLDRRCSPGQVGPGPVLPRWHALLDATLLTPNEMSGPVRSGRSANQVAARHDAAVAPDSSVVLESLSGPFRQYLCKERSGDFAAGEVTASLAEISLSDPGMDGFTIQLYIPA